jgi:hypothetical protein
MSSSFLLSYFVSLSVVFVVPVVLITAFFARRVYAQQDEQEECESPQCGASIAEKGQRNPYHRA